MKKKVLICLMLSIFTIFNTIGYAAIMKLNYDGAVHNYTGPILKLKINGDMVETDVPPIILNNRSLVPARAIFEKLGANVDWNSDQKKVTISMADDTIEITINSYDAYINKKLFKLDVPAKIINARTMVPARFVSEGLGMEIDWVSSQNLVSINNNANTGSEIAGNNDQNDSGTSRGDIDREPIIYDNIEIEHDFSTDGEKVYVNIENIDTYNVFRLSGPDRLVIDITGVNIPEGVQKIDIQDFYVKAVRYSKSGRNTARVVVDLQDAFQYTVQETNKGLAAKITNPTYRNITYNNSFDRVTVNLKNIMLTEGGQTLQKYYTENMDKTNKKYTLTFPTSLGDVGVGILKVNDNLIDKIEIEQNPENTSLIFSLKTNLIFNIIARPETKDTAITILRPYSLSDKLVVIDAGHGGPEESGAVYGGMIEKDVNLDIAKRLDTLLENNGIKTYMIRESDIFIGFYERAYIANKMNAALFVSIHNNAFTSEFHGTETLYFPYSTSTYLSGKEFAQIIQDKLVGALGTKNRGIVERPNLVVLKATTMPAVLAEIAFITNDRDRANLNNAQFKQNAAAALCEGIIEALKRLP